MDGDATTHYFDHFSQILFSFHDHSLSLLLNTPPPTFPLVPEPHRAIQQESLQTTTTNPTSVQPHPRPRPSSPAQAAASSKSDPSRPARDAAPQSPCSLCNLHVNPRLDLLHAFALWTGSRPRRHNNTSKQQPPTQRPPFWSPIRPGKAESQPCRSITPRAFLPCTSRHHRYGNAAHHLSVHKLAHPPAHQLQVLFKRKPVQFLQPPPAENDQEVRISSFMTRRACSHT